MKARSKWLLCSLLGLGIAMGLSGCNSSEPAEEGGAPPPTNGRTRDRAGAGGQAAPAAPADGKTSPR
jgi:hypothetical protein